MKHRLIRAALFAALCLLLCVTALATETETEPALVAHLTAEEEQVEGEELLEGYLTQMFYPDSMPATFGRSGRSQLSTSGKAHYDAIKTEVSKIAAGTRTSTEITVDVSALSGAKTKYTYSELGYTASNADLNAIFTKYLTDLDWSDLYTALLHDCPYELYWHDKTEGIWCRVNGMDVTGTYVQFTQVTFVMEVSSYYAGSGSYTVNATQAKQATTALNNAHNIVARYAGQTDYQKLFGYADTICSMVSYDFDAVENDSASYYTDCNPWHLISAFDGDSSTNIVCEGYSKAFQYLCDNTDFSNNTVCYSVSGNMYNNTGEGGGHMWNVVTYNGKNYLADVTNSDGGSALDRNCGLFMAGAAGSVAGGYRINAYGYSPVYFYYSAATRNLWGDNGILVLAPAGDVPVDMPNAVASTAITQNPTSATVRYDNPVSFTVKATGADLKYQWQYRTSSSGTWTNNSCTSATFSLSAPGVGRDGYQYRCKVTGRDGVTKISTAATLRVFGIKTQPTSVTVASGAKATFKVAATGPNLTYQWQYRTSSAGTWKNNSCTSATFTLADVNSGGLNRNGYQYRCKVTCGSSTITTNAVTLTVKSTAKPVIKTQPQSVVTTADSEVTFSVKATGTGLKYQWQYRTSASDAWKTATAPGNKTASMTFSPVTLSRAGYQYRCKITNEGGTVYTNVVKISIRPSITINPFNKTVKAGSSVTFKVEAVGRYLTYQWQYRAPGGSWKNNNCTSPTFTLANVSAGGLNRNGYQYRCVVTNGAGSATSTAATLTVK